MENKSTMRRNPDEEIAEMREHFDIEMSNCKLAVEKLERDNRLLEKGIINFIKGLGGIQ